MHRLVIILLSTMIGEVDYGICLVVDENDIAKKQMRSESRMEERIW